MRRLLTRATTWLAGGLIILACLAMTALAAASQLEYYGGPVVHSVNLVLVKWGSDVRSTYTGGQSGR